MQKLQGKNWGGLFDPPPPPPPPHILNRVNFVITSSRSKGYGYRVKKAVDPLEKETLNVTNPNFSQFGGPTHERK